MQSNTYYQVHILNEMLVWKRYVKKKKKLCDKQNTEQAIYEAESASRVENK